MHPKAQFTSNNAHKSSTHTHHHNLDDRFAPKPKYHQEDRLHDKNRNDALAIVEIVVVGVCAAFVCVVAGELRLGVHVVACPACISGLYDPVLDNSEYVYVPFELDDLDQESNIDQLKEKQLRSEELIDKSKSTTNFTVHVPPETDVQPRILKQNYKDVFPELNIEELPPEIKYRLPISEQYDPEGKRVTMLYGYNIHSFDDVEKLKYLAKEYGQQLMQNEGFITVNETSDRTVCQTQKFSTNEYNRFQRNDVESDISHIEETAAHIVDNNLDRAVSAANIIKKEIAAKLDKMSILKEKTSQLYELSTEQTNRDHFYENEKSPGAKSSINEVDIKYKKETLAAEEIQKEVSVAEEIKKFETLDIQMDSKLNTKERKLLRQQDIEEAIDAGTVRQITEMFRKESGSRKINKNETFKIFACDQNITNFHLTRRAYNLGLQIIPHLRKATQISKYGRLLFKIFIMKLTKVMIALSKFILLDKHKHLHENSDSFIERGEIIKKAKLSGAQIAQIEGLKPEELTEKMDIVISEFLRKCGKQEQYFENIYSNSKSRSRSNSKSNKEDVISNRVSFEPNTMINERKTRQETYETKKNSKEIREIKSEKRYSEFSSSKMDSRMNLYENAKKSVDDGNIIYIAIVEAHVYTNKDAIFGEELRTISENKNESDALDLGKVYYRCEVSVTYRDFRESSLPPTVIIESIEEIPFEQVYDEEKQDTQETSIPGYEEIAKKLAVQKITEVLEPLLMIKEVKSVNIKHAYPVIETPLKTITETTTLAMEKENNIFQETLWSGKPQVSIEPVKAVVETSVVSVEDESGFVDKLEFAHQQKPQQIVERKAKSIAETTEFIEDEKVETTQCTPQTLQTPHPDVECSVKSVAGITEIVADEAKTNIVQVSKPLSVIPQYKISNNLKSVAETITTNEEADTDILNISKGISVTPRCAFSNNLLSIAETFTATTEEPKQDSLDITKLRKTVVSVGIDNNFATEVVEVFPEEPVPEETVKFKIKGRHSDEFFEKPLLILPETNTVFTEESISERLSLLEPLRKEAKINFKATDIPMCAEITEITLNEKEQNTFDVTSTLEIEPFELTEKPLLSVCATETVLPFGPKEEPLQIDNLKILDARITVKESQATEIAVVCSEEPKERDLKICQVNNKWPKINMERSMLSVAEKLTVHLQETDHKDLEIPKLGVKSSHKLIPDTGLLVAESLLIVPSGPESVDFIVSDTTNEQARIIVDESKATTMSVVYLEEPKSHNLELPIVEEKQPSFSMQDCALTLVIKEEVLPESPNYDDLTPFIYGKDIGKHETDEYRALLETITTCEEPKHENLEIQRVIEKQFKTFIETPQLTVAETSTVFPEFYNDEFYTEDTNDKATVNFVEIENYETTEITAVEPNERHFEVPIIKSQNLVTRMEEVHLSTAESSLIIPEITTNTFDVGKTDKQQASIDVVDNKSVETFLVRPSEPNYEKLEISTVEKNQSETLIERPVLVVAETATAVPEEICNSSFETKILEEKAVVNRLLLENYITTETTAEEAIKKHVEILVINHQKPQTDIERVHLSGAESSITMSEININSFETKKMESHQAHKNMVEQKSIESTLVCPLEPYCDDLLISTVLKNQPDALVETPVLTVAETSIDVTAEYCNDSLEAKISDEKAIVNFVKSHNCETTEITAEETKDHFEEPIIKQHSLVTSMEEVHLLTAESSFIIPEISTNTFDAIKTSNVLVNVDVIENKGIETFIVRPLEPNYEKLEISTVAKKQPETLIERPVLVVAETKSVFPQELCDNSFETKIIQEKVMVNRVLVKNCITTETIPEEAIKNHVEIPLINHQRLQTSIQRVPLSSAESSIIIPETDINSLKIGKTESHQAIVDIVEQKCIEGTLVCPVEPHYVELEISTIHRNQPDALVEVPVLAVAETLTVATAESCNDSFEFKISDEKVTVNIVTMQNRETTETCAEGPKEKHLEIPFINHQSFEVSTEEAHLSTAESSLIIPDSAVNTFDARKSESQVVHVDIVEQKGIESILVYPWEPHCDEKEIPKVIKRKLSTHLETPISFVAETLIVVPLGHCDNKFDSTIKDEQASVHVVAIQNYVITETIVDGTKEKNLETLVINQQKLKIYIEDLFLSVAEISSITPELSILYFDSTKTEMQQIYGNIVEQKSIEIFSIFPFEQNFENTEITQLTTTQPETLIDSSFLNVAETFRPISEEPRCESFGTEVTVLQATVKIIAIQTYETTEITFEEPKVTNFEIPIIKELKLQVGLEEVYLLTAQSLFLLPNESVHIFQSRKMESQNVLIDVVEQKAISSYVVVVWEPNYEDLEVQEIVQKVPQTLIVSSILTVAENLTFFFEEKVHVDCKTIKASAYQAIPTFVKLKVAVKNVVFPEELRLEIFEKPKLFMLEPQHSVVDKYLTVAEIQTILPTEPKEKILDTTEIMGQYAHFEIEACKTAVSSIIFIEEPNIEEFITKGLVNNESENLVELTSKMIAEVTVINICEKEIEFSVPSQSVLKKGNIGFEGLKPVAQNFLIFTEDSKQDVCEYSKFISCQAKTTEIEALATAVSQTIVSNVAKHQLQKPNTAMERKHEVNISEIIDITHDMKNIDSIDITKYNVELAKDYEESFLTQQERENYSKDVDLVTLSSVSTSSSISSAPSSPLIEEYVFGVKGHEYRVRSPQETSLDVITTQVDTGYKIQNMDTSMTIAIEAAIDKFQDTQIEEEVHDIDVKKREFWISDVKINASMESADVNMNIMKSNISLETEQSSKFHSLQDVETSSALITKNRALSYDQAADFEVALESRDSETRNSDSQELATFDFRSGSFFDFAKDIQSTEANLNIKMKSTKKITAENIDVTYGLTIENEIMDDQSMDLSVQISHDSNTLKTNKRKVKKGESKQISLEESKSLSLDKSASIKGSYAYHEEDNRAIYEIDNISTSKKEMSLSESSFSAMQDKLESKGVSQVSCSSAMKGNLESKSIILEKSIRSMEMNASGVMNIEAQISNDALSPSPPTVPSTPLTDYYMFRLQSPYPEESTFVPRDCSFTPESVDEDSLVIINGLIPHIDTKIERILYSPPLQTPDTSPERHTEVILTESEAKLGAQQQEFTKEEIRDTGRESLLASEIDKTIRSIEEYKESVGVSAKKVEETKRVDLGVQKVELSAGKQQMHKINAGQVNLLATDADKSFEGTSETRVKGLKRKTVSHKGLATSISGEQSLTETQQSDTRSSQSSDIQSSSSKLGSSQSSGSKSSSIQSSSIQQSGSKSSDIQLSGFQSSSIQLNVSKSSDIQASGSKSRSSLSSDIITSGIQSSSTQSRGNKSSDVQMSSSQSSDIKSSSIQLGGSKSSDIQSSSIQHGGSKSSDIQSSSIQLGGSKSSGIQASSNKFTNSKSSTIQSSGIQSSDIKSRSIQSRSTQSSGIQSSGIQSSSNKFTSSKSSTLQSSGIQSSDIESSSIKSRSTQSSGIQSSGIQSRSIQLSGNKSSDIQSSGFQPSSNKSTSIKSSNIQSSGTKSTSSKPSSTKSDQKLHLLSRFS